MQCDHPAASTKCARRTRRSDRLPAAMVAGPGTGTRPCTLTLPSTPPFQQGAQEQNRAEKADTDQKPVQ